jgi:hypothetical protein
MTPPKPLGLVGGVTVVLLALVLAAGCGSSASAQAPKAANGKAATVGVASTNLGDVLVNSAGSTGFGAPWYALSPTGSAVTAQGSNGGGGASGY